MTNEEKYVEDLNNIFLNSFGVDKNNKPFRCTESCSERCQFYNNEKSCKILAEQWLNEDYKTDWSKVPVDTPILVKDTLGSRWLHRYFAKYENGIVFAWADGLTSWSAENSDLVTAWQCARLCEDNK